MQVSWLYQHTILQRNFEQPVFLLWIPTRRIFCHNLLEEINSPSQIWIASYFRAPYHSNCLTGIALKTLIFFPKLDRKIWLPLSLNLFARIITRKRHFIMVSLRPKLKGSTNKWVKFFNKNDGENTIFTLPQIVQCV